jgi:PTH1 family peptidyl-tRNA hydrolase
MILIVGLGNPGKKYEHTRHNVGFMVVDQIVKDKLPVSESEKAWSKQDKFQGHVAQIGDILLLKPETYMNLSGKSVASLANFYKVPTKNIWIIHDDIDLPVGKLRIRKGGGTAGHHGIESIITELGESDFIRFRLGIGTGKLDKPHTMDHNVPRQKIEKFVVSPFEESEIKDVKKIIKKASEAVEVALKKGLEDAMNQFN